MNREDTLKMLESNIKMAKEQILKNSDNQEHMRASYFNGMLEAYEGMKEMIEKGCLD